MAPWSGGASRRRNSSWTPTTSSGSPVSGRACETCSGASRPSDADVITVTGASRETGPMTELRDNQLLWLLVFMPAVFALDQRRVKDEAVSKRVLDADERI